MPFLLFVLGLAVLFLSRDRFLVKVEKDGCGCSDWATATGDFNPKEKVAFFEGEKVSPFLAELPMTEESVMGAVLGEKWIEVDLSEQKLTAWQGENIFMQTPVSSGKWYPTPKGDFNIWAKYKYTKMEGGNPAIHTYYYLPNVPYTMFFNKGFGLHGTYWHNNFGQPMSHGCVNLPTVAADKLFYWADPQLPRGKNSVLASKDNPGTRVVVHD